MCAMATEVQPAVMLCSLPFLCMFSASAHRASAEVSHPACGVHCVPGTAQREISNVQVYRHRIHILISICVYGAAHPALYGFESNFGWEVTWILLFSLLTLDDQELCPYGIRRKKGYVCIYLKKKCCQQEKRLLQDCRVNSKCKSEV